jgi:rhodanese-related sulfurtransferase
MTIVRALAALGAVTLAGCARSDGAPCCGTTSSPAVTAVAAREPTLMTRDELAASIRRRDPSIHIFDANPREMYEQRHVPGAHWVPYDDVTADALPQDRSATVVFYCANPRCSASPHAARMAIALGWTNVYVMPDGIFGWVEAGLPVEPG